MHEPDPADVERITRALGWRPTTYRPAALDRGTSSTAARWVVGGGPPSRPTAFVKIGATPRTATWTRIEAANYAVLSGAFLPTVLGFDDDGERPALALEDLSDAVWPPPWTDRLVAGVVEAFAAIHATPPPDRLERATFSGEPNWPIVAADPRPFLGVGLCSDDWLRGALPTLLAAAAAAPLEGEALVHLDVRSDNLCVRDGRTIVIDWNHATIANADLDLAFWLPSLAAEGGPRPEAILPDAPALAAWVAGYFCATAGLPFLPDAPHVRALQRMQAATALPWAARELGLPPPRR